MEGQSRPEEGGAERTPTRADTGGDPSRSTPFILHLGTHDLLVKMDPALEEEKSLGSWDPFPFGQILYAPDQPTTGWYSTILHELIHAISDSYGLNLSEAKTRVLEQALMSALRQNPRFFHALIDNAPSLWT